MTFKFPFSTLHELNLDWILDIVKTLKESNDEFNEKADYAVETADEAKTIAQQAAQAQIPDGSITQSKIANGAVGTDQIENNSITGNKLVVGTVTTGYIADNAINTSKLADSAVNTINIANNAVTNDKILKEYITPSSVPTGISMVIYKYAGLYLIRGIIEAGVLQAGYNDFPVTIDPSLTGNIMRSAVSFGTQLAADDSKNFYGLGYYNRIIIRASASNSSALEFSYYLVPQ